MNERAVYRVDSIVALARHASMSTSYKPALLKALVRIVGARPIRVAGAPLALPLLDVGAEFVRLYWTQTVVFRLRQAATLVREPEVVRAVRDASERARVRDLANLPNPSRRELEAKMARILAINVLAAFHKSKPKDMPTLFHWAKGMAHIDIPFDAYVFLNDHANVLESLANLWWARYLESVNTLAPRVIEKVERNGARRGGLGHFLRILREIDEPRCFYCARPLDRVSALHVDHVIPWSFLLADPLWDLVLACGACNIAKSDVLPQRSFLDKLVETHARRARATLAPSFGSPQIPRDELARLYDAALSVEWPAGWAPSLIST